MALKDIKVQVFFTEDSIPRVVNAELTAKGIEDLEKNQDDFALKFEEWLWKFGHFKLPNGNWIIGLGLKALTPQEVLEKFKKENGL